MEIETKYHLTKLDPPEIDDSDAIASEVVVDVPKQVEQAVEPIVVDQAVAPITEEPLVKKKRERKKKVVEQVEGEVVVKQKRVNQKSLNQSMEKLLLRRSQAENQKTVEHADGEANGEEVVKKK